MRPTSEELLDGIAQALEDRVLPVVQDKWAASTLRSAMQLLRHLATRVSLEPQMLREDSADARLLLQTVASKLKAAALSDLVTAIHAVLDQRDGDPLDTAAADRRNEGYLGAIEQLVAARDRIRLAGGSGDVHESMLAYLQRRLARERKLFLPAFLSAPF